MIDYDVSGIATATEVEQLVEETSTFLALVEAWIGQNHPALAT